MSASRIINECTTCGCNRPWDDHGKGMPTSKNSQKQLKIGAKIEKEHFKGGKKKDHTPEEVAKTHLKENPKYYPSGKKPHGSKEALRYVKEGQPLFYVNRLGLPKPVILEKQWIAYLDVDMAQFEGNEDLADVKQQIIAKLKAKLPEVQEKLDEYEFGQFENIINDLEVADETEEDINYILQDLYDWGDANSVWIGSKGGGGSGSFTWRGSVDL